MASFDFHPQYDGKPALQGSGTSRHTSACFCWRNTWIAVVLIVGCTLCAEEAFLRRIGFQPCVRDSKDLWAYWRKRVYHGHNSVVFLGTSRMQAAISLERLRAVMPDYSFTQLSMVGDSSPIGTLRDFAEDERFTGTIVCEVLEPLLLRSSWDGQSRCYRHRPSLCHLFEMTCETILSDYLVIRSHRCCLPEVVRFFAGARKRRDDVRLVTLRGDRSL
jgi:hypothetical protein